MKHGLLGLLVLGLPVSAQIPADSHQLVVVVTPDWKAPQGTLYTFESGEQGWRQRGSAFAVVVGKNGLGWGRGLLAVPATGPKKVEGDGRAPAGVFSLGMAFGYTPQPTGGTGLAYRQSTAQDRCVDDSSSPFYNQIVPLQAPIAWTSAEEMVRTDNLYRLLVVVNHNTNPPVPQGGSCIFMHIWRAADQPTVGCTAMAEANLTGLVNWLKTPKNPILVQLPVSEYRALKASLGLPKLP
ncbi:L,D-transpeptidase family protein [Anthocerotibacter panamensis]|uniref:L,D-transpeptidase family protein n=1 Tax=Anthocerotibacter panamensis TaxID=2857077 RepID=UPI001C406C95|nr:L,D-transpeptidase family protein [Anthocerotibacter panamensis]